MKNKIKCRGNLDIRVSASSAVALNFGSKQT